MDMKKLDTGYIDMTNFKKKYKCIDHWQNFCFISFNRKS